MAQPLKKSILSINQLLRLNGLTIPVYQRPYKWNVRNVHQLFQDVQQHQQQQAYRLGTIVFHQDTDQAQVLNIVDGQQRTLTLALAVHAIVQTRWDNMLRLDLKNQLADLEAPLLAFMQAQRFDSDISHHNLHQNYLEIKRLVSRSEFTEDLIDCLLNRCQVVTFTLADISEAFQFFDSQNARGRDLEPHDLLKAYHLREFSDQEQNLKATSVATWEALESDELAALFAQYLYRIRSWALGHSARYFGKNEIGLFKGVNINQIAHYPYVESLRIAHHYVDDFNQQYHRKIDGHHKPFPFCLDQIIINGRRFFEMAAHYQTTVQDIVDAENGESSRFLGVSLSPQARDILHLLNSYPKRQRTGDQFVRAMFDCALIYYMDKFGGAELSNAIERIFIWAFQVRIKQQLVQLATIDNHVLANNIFQVIKEATQPAAVLSLALPTLSDSDNKNNVRDGNVENDPLVKQFKAMKYYE